MSSTFGSSGVPGVRTPALLHRRNSLCDLFFVSAPGQQFANDGTAAPSRGGSTPAEGAPSA
jgi:hypothetical protein